MKRRIAFGIVSMVLMAATWLFWLHRSSARMVSYQGKTAEYWLTQVFTTNQQKAIAAFKAMGTNGEPVLIGAFKKWDTAWDRYYQKKYPKLPVWMHKRFPEPFSAKEGWEAAQFLVINHFCTGAIKPELIRLLAEKNNPARVRIMPGVLAYLTAEDTNCLPVLIDCLQDKRVDVRYQAIAGLERFGIAAKAAVPALTVAMNDRTMVNTWPAGWDGGFETRIAAARAVWKIGNETNGPEKVFREGLSATNAHVQGWSCIYLSEMEPNDPSLVPPLIALLQGGDMGLQMSAASVIGRYGPTAKTAVPALQALMASNNFEIRQRALTSLKKIDPAAAAKYQR